MTHRPNNVAVTDLDHNQILGEIQRSDALDLLRVVASERLYRWMQRGWCGEELRVLESHPPTKSTHGLLVAHVLARCGLVPVYLSEDFPMEVVR